MSKTKNTPPVVEIEKLDFEDSSYVRGDKVWTAKQLYDQVEKEKLEPFDYPLAGYNLFEMGFQVRDMWEFVYHAKRVERASYDYPIILDDCGQIADGYHRIAKALLDGKATIKAYRLKEMPQYDHLEPKE